MADQEQEKQPAKKLLGVQLDEAFKERLERIARGRGLNTSEAVRRALVIWMNCSDEFWHRIADKATRFNVPVWVVIQNHLNEVLAQEEAMIEADIIYSRNRRGGTTDSTFRRDLRGKVITGEIFFEMVKREEVDYIEETREEPPIDI